MTTIMKKNIFITVLAAAVAVSCVNLDEKVYSSLDKGVFYQNENSVKAAVASVYNEAQSNLSEKMFYLQEYSADQMAWRIWNDGWGYDEGEKYVLSVQRWNSESKIILQAWQESWTTIGLANNIIYDLQTIEPSDLKMSREQFDSYIAELRTLRAWCYYINFQAWGGSLPLCNTVSDEVPPSESRRLGSFEAGCRSIYDFIATELDESVDLLPKGKVNRMNQAMNRMLRAQLALNAGLFIGEERYDECADICEKIIGGDYGTYSIVSDYRDIFKYGNRACPEVIFAFACEDGQSPFNMGNTRNLKGLPYNWKNIMGDPDSDASGWNCEIVVPSHDNSGEILSLGGTDTGGESFLGEAYGDKLGAVYERFDDRDIRKKAYSCPSGVWNGGLFLKGAQYEYGTTSPVKADADRDGMDLVYVDQLATFRKPASVKPVMSPYYGEVNSGYRLIKYPMYPATSGIDFRNIDNVEFRLAEAYYMLAECKLRSGDAGGAKDLVDTVRGRYFSSSDKEAALAVPGPGFEEFDLDWMLSEWGKEFLSEGRRRRTDLRRYDKFTQGQWWFFGRATDVDGSLIPVKRDRKYEWYPLPQSAFQTNSGLQQTPGY